MNTNFGPGDYHTVLTYTKDQRPDPDGARKYLKKFLGDLRKEYRKREQVLKYIIVTEWEGKSIHHHILLNNISGTDKLDPEAPALRPTTQHLPGRLRELRRSGSLFRERDSENLPGSRQSEPPAL